MRRMLRILKWLGLSLSTLLLAATVFCWVRSLGYEERWGFERFEPRPDWRAPDLAGKGIWRGWSAKAIHGRLWLTSWTQAPVPEFKPETQYRRDPISADQANEDFNRAFQPGEHHWSHGLTQRVWRFAGAGLRHSREAIDRQTGRPTGVGFTLALPFWMLAVVFGLWPVLFVGAAVLRKKHHTPGHCPACGYDLRATPDRCPECGHVVEPKPSP